MIPIRFAEAAVDRAAAARRRSRDAADAIARAHRRIAEQPPDREDRLASARTALRRALERSEAAHLDAAELYEIVGQARHAEQHRAEAQLDAVRRAELQL